MAYPGNSDLSPEAQDRVLSTFREVIRNLQSGKRDEAKIGLEFVLRLDPSFAPGADLQRQLAAEGEELDLESIIGALSGPNQEELNAAVVEAVDLFNERRFKAAKKAAEGVLRELPGHREARDLLQQIEQALKVEAQVADFLSKAREALARSDGQEAANFVTMAQALDPNHPAIADMLADLEQAARNGAINAPTGEPPPPEPTDAAASFDEGFSVQFESLEESTDTSDDASSESGPDQAGSPTEAEDFSVQFESVEQSTDTGADASSETVSEEAGSPPEHEDTPSFSLDEEGTDSEVAFQFGGGAEADFSLAEEPAVKEETTLSDDSESGPAPDQDAELSDLFSLPEEDGGDTTEEHDDDSAEGDDRVAELLAKGQQAFDSGSFQEAIDVWSRVYLVDPSSEVAGERIDEARARLEETSRELELLLHQANEAADHGRVQEALEAVDDILARQPGHLEALDLKERLKREAETSAPAPAAKAGEEAHEEGDVESSASGEHEFADLEEDLFHEDLPAEVPAPESAFELPDIEELPAPSAARRRSIQLRPVLLAVAALLVVAVGAWLGSKLLTGRGDQGNSTAVEHTIRQAEALYRQGQVEEAIHLLQEAPASPMDQARIARRIARYQKVLQPPTPTPVPQSLEKAETAAREGHWLQAYRTVVAGLGLHPEDQGLLELKDQITEQEPLVVSLERAIARRDPATALSVARQLEERHPKDELAAAEVNRWLFNGAVAELHTYNLTGAEVLLAELSTRKPGDEEVGRILELIRTYKNRPVDMQLKIFISSISTR